MTTVIPEGLTFDEYHPSMAPIFEAIARRAVSDGRAFEYNEMADTLGFPNLDALSVDTEREARFTVPLTVTIIREIEVTIDRTINVEDAEETVEESDFISNYRSEIEDAIGEYYSDIEIGDIDEIAPHGSESIRFEEWVD